MTFRAQAGIGQDEKGTMDAVLEAISGKADVELVEGVIERVIDLEKRMAAAEAKLRRI